MTLALNADERLTALGNLVSHIVGIRSERQMLRVYTGSVIATMTNVEAIRDRAMVDFK